MTTRREALRNAGLIALAGALGACRPASQATSGDRLLLAHDQGLGIFDGGTGSWLADPATATADGDWLAGVDGVHLRLRHTRTLEARWSVPLSGRWTPRAVRGDQVALVSGNAGSSVYQPMPRTETSLLVTKGSGERRRLKLAGNLEPEAFSPDGNNLYLLDYLPPKAPDVYRVRVLDIDSGVVSPLQTQAKQVVPPDAEEVMRGQGRHAVYDEQRGILFTLYTHGGDHRHTGQLLGVRPDAPGIHSFIHALHLGEGWAVCIDLPAPFGTEGFAGHTIARSDSTVYAITAAHGVVAEINPDELAIRSTRSFVGAPGPASAIMLPGGQLLIAAGRNLSLLDDSNRSDWKVDFEIRGLATGTHLWAGRAGGVAVLDAQTRKVLRHMNISGVVGLREAVGPA